MVTEVTQSVVGLIDLISQAPSAEEVQSLVAKGKSEYKNASPKTVKRWNIVAERRIAQLNAPEPVAVEPTPKKEKKK